MLILEQSCQIHVDSCNIWDSKKPSPVIRTHISQLDDTRLKIRWSRNVQVHIIYIFPAMAYLIVTLQ